MTENGTSQLFCQSTNDICFFFLHTEIDCRNWRRNGQVKSNVKKIQPFSSCPLPIGVFSTDDQPCMKGRISSGFGMIFPMEFTKVRGSVIFTGKHDIRHTINGRLFMKGTEVSAFIAVNRQRLFSFHKKAGVLPRSMWT